MRITTLCYITCGEKTLMLYRNKKENDENAGKWVGIGGKLEAGESPEDCLIREVREECGITLSSYKFCGIVTFVSDIWGTEYMCLYTAECESRDIADCTEGELYWIDNEKVSSLPMWEGDRIFFELMEKGEPFFSLKLVYKGDDLAGAYLNGEEIKCD